MCQNVKNPTQSFPKFCFGRTYPLSNYWGLYTIPNYWVITSGTPSAPPYTSFVFGNYFSVFRNAFLFGNTFLCLWILFLGSEVSEYYFFDRIRIRIIFGIRILTKYEYEQYSFFQNERIRIRIIFVQKYLTEYEYE